MASGLFTDIASTVLSKKLDAAASRQKTIANNIANVETPGFRRSYVSFEDELKRVLDQDDRRSVRKALKDLVPVRQTDFVSPARPDGNNVNIDAEIADLAKNSLDYKATTTLMEAKTAMLRSAITGGR